LVLELKEKIKQSSYDDTIKITLFTELEKYSKKFNDVVMIEKEVGYGAYEGQIYEYSIIANNVVFILEQHVNIVTQQTHEKIQSSIVNFFILIGIVIIASVVSSHIMNKTISDSVNQLEKTKELEKDLAISNEQLKNEKLTTMGLLSARLSHDLRNPLAVIKTLTQVYRHKNQDSLNEEEIKRFDRIDDAIDTMVHQIEGVLAFVQNKPLNLEKISISTVLNNAISLVQKLESVIITLPENDLEINIDSKKLEVVFYNLIANAIQAMDENGTITIQFKQTNDHVTINLEDSGPGVPNDLINKIFDPLFTTKNLGTGLGLSSCKSITEQHGGTITVSNNPSVFSVILPINLTSELDVIKNKEF